MSTNHKKADKFVDEVQTAARNGEAVNLYEKQREAGYSHSSAKSYKGVNTKTYKQRMKPFIKQLEEERDRIIAAMANKNLDEETYDTLNRALKDVTKNTQLLGGNATEVHDFRIVEGAGNKQIENDKKEAIETTTVEKEEKTTDTTNTGDKDA